MRKLVQISFFLLIVFLSFRLMAQDITADASVDAGTVAKQRTAAIDVNLFTGIPQIRVPLFAYSRGELKLSVDLSYFAGGVQVREKAPEAGMSWSLNAGGAIMRSVRGGPDDFTQIGFLYTPVLPQNVPDNVREDIFYNKQDAQADIYIYSVNGLSGKFMIGKDKKIYLSEQRNISIIPEFSTVPNASYTLTAFTIITEDGVRYEFRDIELEKLDTQDDQSLFINKYYPSAWHLTSIKDPYNSDSINFQYEESGAAYDYSDIAESLTFIGFDKFYSMATSSLNRNLLKIKRIILPSNQSVEFDRSARMEGGAALNTIRILNNGKEVERFRLDYMLYDAYYKNWEEHPELQLNGHQYGPTLRSFLRRIVRVTPAGHLIHYAFTYNKEYLLPDNKWSGGIDRFENLPDPALGIHSRDHWGFYNGKMNNSSIPASVAGIPAGDREPSATHVLAGSLKSVTYPDGMVRAFEFESHERANINNIAMEVSARVNASGSYTLELAQHYTNQHQLQFRFDPGTDIPLPTNCTFVLTLKDAAGNVVRTGYLSINDLLTGDVIWALNTPSANYTLSVQTPSNCSFPVESAIRVTWTNTRASGQNVIGGGIRIAKVTTYAGNQSVAPLITRYKYTLADGVTSSGYMAHFPRYDYRRTTYYSNNVSRETRIVASDPYNNLKYVSGNVVGYSRVEVSEGPSGESGKTVYEFSDFRDVNFNQQQVEYPYVPVEKAEWGLGLPKKILLYDKSGRLVKKTTHEYNIIQQALTDENVASLLVSHTISYAHTSETKVLKGNRYYPLSGRTELSKSISYSYYANNDSLLNITSYTYSPKNFNVKTLRQDFNRETGSVIEKRYYYPDDYTVADGILKVLRDKGIVKLVATEEWLTGGGQPARMTGGEIVEYSTFNNFIRPYHRYAFASNAPVLQQVVGDFNPAVLIRKPELFKAYSIYTQYDEKGFPRTSQVNGKTMSVMMSPDKQFPVMSVANAAYDQVAYTSFESDDKGNFQFTGAPQKDENALTGDYVYPLSAGIITKKNISLSTPYVLSLWYKGNAPVVSGATQIATAVNTNTGWIFSEYRVNLPAISISGQSLIDEVRLFPQGAVMTTTTYEPFLGVTSTCGADNMPVYYSYDALKRPILTRNHNKHIIEKKEYVMNAPLSTTPVWDYTERYRCQTNANGMTGIQEVEQTDINSNSSTWGTFRWIVSGQSDRCTPKPIWELTGRKRCVTTSQGVNTGTIEVEKKDVNPNSASYGTFKWESGGTDETLCPVPVVCEGESKKMINGKCETGVKVIIESEPQNTGWMCTYQYQFSDGSIAGPFQQYSPTRCF
ncbi:hypothetical protein ACTJJB_32330 [Chitinophaga sp. 22536]|uniref:hypothetical protein n=1 Tax=unclassified Chitinophaga TaxID=2619133 RepID=UPI003F852ED8